MPDWNQILDEIKATGTTHDSIRRRYLNKLHKITNRNVIIYYSGWLQKPNLNVVGVSDADMNGFMTVIHELDRSKGLDLVLHTPGGNIAATEAIVNYLRRLFGNDIRAFIPQLAMSAGTMIACACKEIFMGEHSSLGPIDPQFSNIPAYGVVEEFERARQEISQDPSTIPIWQPILAKYSPTLVGECEKAIKWANAMVIEWLRTGMFAGLKEEVKQQKSEEIVDKLADHSLSKTHERHLTADYCKEIGLKVYALEDDRKLQDAVLSVHHACIHTLGATSAFKIIENHSGKAFIQMAHQVVGPGEP